MAWTFEATRAGYEKLWNTISIKGGADDKNASRFADRIIKAEDKYRAVQAVTGVPWWKCGVETRSFACREAKRSRCFIGSSRLSGCGMRPSPPFPTRKRALQTTSSMG